MIHDDSPPAPACSSGPPPDSPRIGFLETLRVDEYTLVGSTRAQLERAIAVLGPTREGLLFGAFTEWTIRWHHEPSSERDILRPVALRLALDLRVVLPSWRSPRSADPRLVVSFERYRAALICHEKGHVALARLAVATLCHRLPSLPVCPSADALHDAACQLIRHGTDALRRQETAYDARTKHGALQGATLEYVPGLTQENCK